MPPDSNPNHDQAEQQRDVIHPPEPLEPVVKRLRHAVILAGPGGGKSEFLKYQARSCTRCAFEALAQTKALETDIPLPVFMQLRTLAAELKASREAQLCGLVEAIGAGSITIAGLSAEDHAAAAILMTARRKLKKKWTPRFGRTLWDHLTALPGTDVAQRIRLRGYEGVPALICLDGWNETPDTEKKLLREHLRRR